MYQKKKKEVIHLRLTIIQSVLMIYIIKKKGGKKINVTCFPQNDIVLVVVDKSTTQPPFSFFIDSKSLSLRCKKEAEQFTDSEFDNGYQNIHDHLQ